MSCHLKHFAANVSLFVCNICVKYYLGKIVKYVGTNIDLLK